VVEDRSGRDAALPPPPPRSSAPPPAHLWLHALERVLARRGGAQQLARVLEIRRHAAGVAALQRLDLQRVRRRWAAQCRVVRGAAGGQAAAALRAAAAGRAEGDARSVGRSGRRTCSKKACFLSASSSRRQPVKMWPWPFSTSILASRSSSGVMPSKETGADIAGRVAPLVKRDSAHSRYRGSKEIHRQTLRLHDSKSNLPRASWRIRPRPVNGGT
jgi:hypothetical protein